MRVALVLQSLNFSREVDMKLAWIENERIRDIAWTHPANIFHPDIAGFYDTEVPDDAVNGDGWVDGQLIKPQPVAPAAPPPRTWTVGDVRSKLTLSERVKWDNDKTDTIKTAKIEFAAVLEQTQTEEVLQMLVDAGDISQASMVNILA